MSGDNSGLDDRIVTLEYRKRPDTVDMGLYPARGPPVKTTVNRARFEALETSATSEREFLQTVLEECFASVE